MGDRQSAGGSLSVTQGRAESPPYRASLGWSEWVPRKLGPDWPESAEDAAWASADASGLALPTAGTFSSMAERELPALSQFRRLSLHVSFIHLYCFIKNKQKAP
ncbi:hypothetical protein XENTR_v10003163 [Xenopus tropicalis]|nr:hypothetical protein XENTR_v10003163 [Xenopus tropicalis]